MWRDRFRWVPDHPKTVEVPATYQPRATRFHLEAAVSFTGDERKYDGQCIDVSDSGLLASFGDPPELWTDGKISLEAGEHYLSINARVARMQGCNVGFAFSVEGENDRAAIRILIDAVSDSPLED